MTASFGKITAELAEPIEQVSDELINLINLNINPPEPVQTDKVCVRAMYVVSDEINSFGGRFPADEHPRLSSLLIDSPVLVGHRKDKLPIGRNFHTTQVTRNGSQWIKCYFYWLKSADGAENLRENIDGGIYKECSIGFTYMLPECSVCGEDIRRCDHQPLQKIIQNGNEAVIHFNYRKIERVLETSLVYRGALPNTSLSKELHLPFAESSLNEPSAPAEYSIYQSDGEDTVTLIISESDNYHVLQVKQFNFNRLKHGARFVAQYLPDAVFTSNAHLIGKGLIERVSKTNGSYLLKLSDTIEGQFVIQPMRLDGVVRYLFYRKLFDSSSQVSGPLTGSGQMRTSITRDERRADEDVCRSRKRGMNEGQTRTSAAHGS